MTSIHNPELRYFCFACRTLRADVGEPHPEGDCPKCGNNILSAYTPGEEFKITAGGFRFTSKPADRGRWDSQSQAKHEIFRKTGHKHFVQRVIDRVSNWYSERIVDVNTGKVVRQVEEPLSEHTGRGSARKRFSKDGPSGDA